MYVPKRGLPSDAGWSSAKSELWFELRMTQTLLLADLRLLRWQILTKFMLLLNPSFESGLLTPENGAGNTPVAIFLGESK